MATKSLIAEEDISTFFMSGEVKDTPQDQKVESKPAPKKNSNKRDYRINLALKHSTGEAIKKEAEEQGRSVNNLIEVIIETHLNKVKHN